MRSKILDNALIIDTIYFMTINGYQDLEKHHMCEEVRNSVQDLANIYAKNVTLLEINVSSEEDIISIKEDNEIISNKIAKLLGKKECITLEEFSIRYLEHLKQYKGICPNFDIFLDWLEMNKENGIINSFYELQIEDSQCLIKDFLNEKIKIDTLSEYDMDILKYHCDNKIKVREFDMSEKIESFNYCLNFIKGMKK